MFFIPWLFLTFSGVTSSILSAFPMRVFLRKLSFGLTRNETEGRSRWFRDALLKIAVLEILPALSMGFGIVSVYETPFLPHKVICISLIFISIVIGFFILLNVPRPSQKQKEFLTMRRMTYMFVLYFPIVSLLLFFIFPS